MDWLNVHIHNKAYIHVSQHHLATEAELYQEQETRIPWASSYMVC